MYFQLCVFIIIIDSEIGKKIPISKLRIFHQSTILVIGTVARLSLEFNITYLRPTCKICFVLLLLLIIRCFKLRLLI